MTQKHLVITVVVAVVAVIEIMVNPWNTYVQNYSFNSLNLRTTLVGKHYYHHFQMKRLKKRINSLLR